MIPNVTNTWMRNFKNSNKKWEIDYEQHEFIIYDYEDDKNMIFFLWVLVG